MPAILLIFSCRGALGVAILDANLDGMMDVFCLQNAGWNSGQTHVLFLQNTEGAFVPAGPEFGLSVDGHAMGVSAGRSHQ